jgi:hypothetical protein
MTFEPLSKRVIGCAIEVHRELGPGFGKAENWPPDQFQREGSEGGNSPVCPVGKGKVTTKLTKGEAENMLSRG